MFHLPHFLLMSLYSTDLWTITFFIFKPWMALQGEWTVKATLCDEIHMNIHMFIYNKHNNRWQLGRNYVGFRITHGKHQTPNLFCLWRKSNLQLHEICIDLVWSCSTCYTKLHGISMINNYPYRLQWLAEQTNMNMWIMILACCQTHSHTMIYVYI